jgi:hypothetical protein
LGVALSDEENPTVTQDAAESKACEAQAAELLEVCDESHNPAECNILSQFGKNHNYKSWKKSSGWLDNEDHCTWHGVSCDGEKQVKDLILMSNQIAGDIADLGSLSGLTKLSDLVLARLSDQHASLAHVLTVLLADPRRY